MLADATEWVALTPRFISGWPWPEESYGLDPMYGPDGWCHTCGVPLRPQIGPLTIQGSKFPSAAVWMPNWNFDVVCVGAEVASEVSSRFAVAMRRVEKPKAPTDVMQLLPEVTEAAWYRPDLLSEAIRDQPNYDGGPVGEHCPTCGRWKWLPITEGKCPVGPAPLQAGSDLIASPEMFGSGKSSFRHLMFRRPLGEFLVSANSRTWSVVELAELHADL